MPPNCSPSFCRVLQDREFERLGGIRTLHVDVRIISATNRGLHKDVAEKNFRADLFYRLNVFPIELPPLRERGDDIPVLVQHSSESTPGAWGSTSTASPRTQCGFCATGAGRLTLANSKT